VNPFKSNIISLPCGIVIVLVAIILFSIVIVFCVPSGHAAIASCIDVYVTSPIFATDTSTPLFTRMSV